MLLWTSRGGEETAGERFRGLPRTPSSPDEAFHNVAGGKRFHRFLAAAEGGGYRRRQRRSADGGRCGTRRAATSWLIRLVIRRGSRTECNSGDHCREKSKRGTSNEDAWFTFSWDPCSLAAQGGERARNGGQGGREGTVLGSFKNRRSLNCPQTYQTLSAHRQTRPEDQGESSSTSDAKQPFAVHRRKAQ